MVKNGSGRILNLGYIISYIPGPPCSYETTVAPIVEDVDCSSLEFLPSDDFSDEDYMEEVGMEYEDNYEYDIEESANNREYLDNTLDNSNKVNSLTLIETLVIKKYLCNHCGNIITIVGDSAPKFCIECGKKQEVSQDKAYIDNLEDTNCTLKDIERRNNIKDKLVV